MKLSKEKVFEQKRENIIVALSMIGIIILTFIIFGWSSIQSFLTSPIIWKGQDSLEVHYFGTWPGNEEKSKYNIILSVYNKTGKEISEYDIAFNVEGLEYEYKSFNNKDMSSGFTDISIPVTENDVSSKTFQKLITSNKDNLEDVEVSYRIKYLTSHGEKIVNNNGWIKDILIVALSLALGIVGFLGNIEKKWLRITFKLCAIPAVLVIIAGALLMYAVAYSNSPEGQAALAESRKKEEERQRNKAANDYKSAAHTKAACEARGDYRGAAYAQEQMDKSRATMITGSTSSHNAYNSAAHTKAAATARGDYKCAARAQAEMDKNMADMLKNK